MKISAVVFTAISLVAGSVSTACRDASLVPEPELPAVVRVSDVELDRQALEMTIGDREFLAAEFTPQNADNQAVTWSSSDTAVATVDSSGEVNALETGETTIGVRTLDGGFEAFCNVTVARADDPENPDDPTDPDPDPDDPIDPNDPENPDQDNPENSDQDDPDDSYDGDDPDDTDPDNPDDGNDDDPSDPDPTLGGVIGELVWSLDLSNGALTVTGSGDLPDYPTPTEAPPWSVHRSKIVTLVLPAGIGAIGANNFASCDNLTTVEIAAKTPPQLGSGNFNAQYYDTLIAPKTSAALYRNASAWSDAFNTIVGRE